MRLYYYVYTKEDIPDECKELGYPPIPDFCLGAFSNSRIAKCFCDYYKANIDNQLAYELYVKDVRNEKIIYKTDLCGC